MVKRFSGQLGQIGYSDGTLDSALFNKPRSFTVDVKGNVYVADKNNHVIRKIANSGLISLLLCFILFATCSQATNALTLKHQD